MKVLVSGFDAFGEDRINPSLEIVKHLPKQINDIEIYPIKIPTQAKQSVEILKAKIKEIRPDFVLNIGVAKGRETISIERIAINVDDFSIPDNAGYQPIDIEIEANGKDGYFSNLPIKTLMIAMKQEGYNAYISNTAGTFVCNHVMYAMQYLVRHEYPKMKTGFIHVPAIKSENQVGMQLQEMVDAILCLITHLNDSNIKQEAGSLW